MKQIGIEIENQNKINILFFGHGYSMIPQEYFLYKFEQEYFLLLFYFLHATRKTHLLKI